MSSTAVYRSFERHLIRAVVALANEPGLPAATRLRWIAAMALKNEEPEGLDSLTRELEPEASAAAEHLRGAAKALHSHEEG
ncbi:MAG: hypothetical protein SGJ01_13195 [Gemmatimonadota bacterium]|nr:hypothetical protein [Gemmatimonadota bacterium]